jgi:L-ribulose-5-phosphate 3-epimerase
MKRGICIGSLPKDASLEERFELARRAGFDGVEINTIEEPAEREEMARLARRIGIELHSVMASGHWKTPLSSADEETRRAGLANIRASVDTARAVGASTVLVVPGVVNETQSYAQVYETALGSVRELAAYAEQHGVRLGIENVWNRFLLSPREMGQFLSEVGSRSVGLYFDCGNILAYGYPQVWIRELGPCIVKVHVKDYDTNTRQFRHLLQGSVNWREVRTALREVGYDDYLTAELPLYPSYPEQMVIDTAAQIARIIDGE